MIRFDYHLILFILISFSHLLLTVNGRYRRCYTCRSRGPLGDCRDPFYPNSTAEATEAVKRTPCPSGWCGKALEGREDDHLRATHRMCLLVGPSDNLERCSDTFYENKKRFMCFCKGDLCNRSVHSTSSMSTMLLLLLIVLPVCLVNSNNKV